MRGTGPRRKQTRAGEKGTVLGRKILVPTTVAVALRARHTLVAMVLVALLALAFAAPVSAQEETPNRTQTAAKDKGASGKQYQSVQGGEQQAEAGDEQTADPLEGQTATIAADSIGPIAVAGCEAVAGETASITIAATDDEDTGASDTQRFSEDDEGVEFQFDQQGITIAVERDGTDPTDRFGTTSGEVVRSEGIVCDDGGGQRADDDDDGNDAKDADDLQDLSCEELLVLFRGESSSGGQYADAAFFADSEVRAQVEVCLEEEIVEGTAADEDLPDTGGPSLLALAVLGLVSAAAGLSVIRGGRR